MAALHVHLSNFRVSHSTQSNIGPVQILLRSPQVHIKPIESPTGVLSDDGHALNFPSWKAKWEEHPPAASSKVLLCLRSVDLRSKWRRRRSYIVNPFRSSNNKSTLTLAQSSLNLATIATSTVRRSVRIPSTTRDGAYYDVSFDAVVEERRDVRILLDRVSVVCPSPLRSAYLVVAVNGRHVLAPERFVHVASPTFDDVPPVILPRCSLAKLARAKITIRVHEAEDGNRCVGEIQIPMHDVWSSAIRSGYASPFRGNLFTRLEDESRDEVNDDDGDVSGPENENENETQVEQNDESMDLDNEDTNNNNNNWVGTIEGSVVLHNVPTTGQMVGGVTTHEGMTGGRPIFCGAVVPAGDIVRSNLDILRLPYNWVELFDTFGYRFYHNIGTAQNAWISPSEAYDATEHDALLATLGFERTENNLFRSLDTGAESWVHPAAERIPPMTASTSSGDTESDVSSIRYGLTPHSTPGSIRHMSMPSRTVSSFSLPRAPSIPFPAELTLSELPSVQRNPTPVDASEPTNVPELSSSNSLTLDDISHGRRYPREKYLTEMKWIRLRERGDNQVIPGPSTEAHSLTTVSNGKTVIKFGGKSNAGKSNEVFAYDADSMNWSALHPLGAPPAPRFGHAAVALGSDKSRMLVFGGSSAQGRMNDLHILHMDNLAWSPVHASGTPPEARARMGMCVTDGGDLAMLFGGRTVYRFLGGKYFDSDHVNVFHAARSQWVQMTPRGSGLRPAPRSGCAVEFVNERCMFVHGGYDDGDQYYSDSWLFDLSSSTWQQTPYPGEPTEPKARESHASTVLDGDVLVYGGEMERGGYSSSLSVFDTSNLRWRAEIPRGYTPPALVGAKMATVNNSTVLLAGGDSGFSMSREAFVLDVERFERTELDTLKERARSRDMENEVCAVCLDSEVEAMFVWCGHTVCCNRCARKLYNCPICRRPIGTILQLR